MVVTTKQRDAFNNLLNIDVCLGADSLDQSKCIDYLGVKLDAHLTWNSKIHAVYNKLVFAIFRLGRLRNVIAPNFFRNIIYKQNMWRVYKHTGKDKDYDAYKEALNAATNEVRKSKRNFEHKI